MHVCFTHLNQLFNKYAVSTVEMTLFTAREVIGRKKTLICAGIAGAVVIWPHSTGQVVGIFQFNNQRSNAFAACCEVLSSAHLTVCRWGFAAFRFRDSAIWPGVLRSKIGLFGKKSKNFKQKFAEGTKKRFLNRYLYCSLWKGKGIVRVYQTCKPTS